MKIIIWSILMLLSYSSSACDGCNVYSPVGLINSRHKLSVFARQRTTYGAFSQLGEMITKHSGHANDPNIWGKSVLEHYQTYEFRGDFYIKKKLQISVILPFTNNIQKLDNKKRFSLFGLSDPTLMLGYSFFNDKEKSFKHRLTVISGAKIGIGLINLRSGGFIPNLDFQPGTGAHSFLAGFNYSVKHKKWILNSVLNYKQNGFNAFNYKYGKTVNGRIDLIKKVEIKNSDFMFLLGGYSEWAGLDESVIKHEDTGGTILFANVGIKWLTNNFVTHLEYQPVVSQNLNGTTQLLTKNRINIGLTYVL